MKLNDTLKRDPLAFAQKYSICGHDDAAKGFSFERQYKSGDYTFSKMTGLSKIAFLDCRHVRGLPSPRTDDMPKNYLMKNEGPDTVFVTPFHEDRGSLVPAWFLPWDSSGGMVKLSIPSKTWFEVDGWKANRINTLRFDDPYLKGVNEYPKFFLTSAINGCSVFVTGNEQEPTIFHGGKAGTVGDGSVSSAAQTWRDMLAEVDKPKVKPVNPFYTPAPKVRLTVGEVNKSMYVKDGVTLDKSGYHTTPTAKALEAALTQKGFMVREIRPWGAVFGVCDDLGSWKFYLQQNASISYDVVDKKTGWGPMKKTMYKSLCVARPMTVRQIFPNYGGAAIMQANVGMRPLPT